MELKRLLQLTITSVTFNAAQDAWGEDLEEENDTLWLRERKVEGEEGKVPEKKRDKKV